MTLAEKPMNPFDSQPMQHCPMSYSSPAPPINQTQQQLYKQPLRPLAPSLSQDYGINQGNLSQIGEMDMVTGQLSLQLPHI